MQNSAKEQSEQNIEISSSESPVDMKESKSVWSTVKNTLKTTMIKLLSGADDDSEHTQQFVDDYM